MGISTAYWMARAGIEVLLLEAEKLGCGASGRNAGLVLPSMSPLEAPGILQSVLTDEGIAADYHIGGHLSLASTDEIWARVKAEVGSRPKTLPTLLALDRGECEAVLNMRIGERFRGGRWYPDGALIDPVRLVDGLSDAANRAGAQIHCDTRVLKVATKSVASGSPLQIHTSRGSLEADHVVFACNAGLLDLVPGAGRALEVRVAQVLSSEPMPPLFKCGMAVDWGTVYWRQAQNGSIVIGGLTSKIVPLPEVDQDPLIPAVQSALEEFLPSVFPEMPVLRVHRRWHGVMDCTSDGRPLVGRLPGARRQWIIAGFNGHGLPPALGFAKALTESVFLDEPVEQLARYSPARFPEVGQTQ